MPGQTPSQPVGPFFAYGLTPELYHYPYRSAVGDRLLQSGTEGQRIRIEGRVLGYDALFVPTGGDGRTFAQMTAAEKHELSHRGQAFRALVSLLASR